MQAYSKRSLPLIDWLAEVAQVTGRRIPVRLVKGAYWDSEIKWAQQAGLADYPVFTRKVNTDVAYLAASRALLARSDCFYPQFATHNAHTVAWVATIAGDRPYEFQRLYGMGEALHREVVHPETLAKPCRIYAPVGGYRDLLAYLVRRLLENGANTSFVNRLADDAAPIAIIVADPVARAAAPAEKANQLIKPPPELFAPERRNSLGVALFEPSVRSPLLRAMRIALASPPPPTLSSRARRSMWAARSRGLIRRMTGARSSASAAPRRQRPSEGRCTQPRLPVTNGIVSAAPRAHRCSTAPPICSRQTGLTSWR